MSEQSVAERDGQAICFNYGGGRQTIAMVIMMHKGIIPWPDRMVIADTGRENRSTWEYLDKYAQPLVSSHGREIEIAPRELATVDLYSHQGTMLMPVYTKTGKFSSYCSGEWKRDVVERHLKRSGVKGGTTWLGLAVDESTRWKRSRGTARHGFTVECPLVDRFVTTDNCLRVIRDFGWPEPIVSSCRMCPNKRNSEWRYLRDHSPEEFELACQMDEQIRAEDERGEMWLHHSRVPLREANIDVDESKATVRQCDLGLCFV